MPCSLYLRSYCSHQTCSDMIRFVGFYVAPAAQKILNIIDTFEKAMLFVGIDIEMFLLAGSVVCHCLGRKIHRHLHIRILRYACEEISEETFAHCHRKHEIVQFIVLVNVGKKTGYHHTETIIGDSPSRMFAT